MCDLLHRLAQLNLIKLLFLEVKEAVNVDVLLLINYINNLYQVILNHLLIERFIILFFKQHFNVLLCSG